MGDLPAARAYLLEALQVTSAMGLLAYLAIALFHYATLLIKESAGESAGSTQKRSGALALLMLVQKWVTACSILTLMITKIEI